MEVLDRPIKLPDGTEIDGKHSVVIIGPNGSGKTTYGAELARLNRAEWIGATRNLQFGDSIAMQTPEKSSQQVTQVKNQQLQSPWTLSSELNTLLAKLKADDAQSAIMFRNQAISNSSAQPERTKIIELTHLWNSIFPGREIDFSSYSPQVKAGHRNNAVLNISRMSGGERVALYLLARVLDAGAGIIFVDEPEIHFHSVLAKRFWSEMEVIRSDCRFVYITHDLPFAISRKDVQFIVISSFEDRQLLPIDDTLPPEIIESILGAATFSIASKRIVFCEGSRYNQRDDSLYSSWFSEEETSVIPVGSCSDVIKCVEVFNSNPVLNGVNAIGLIDRDYWPDDYLSSLPPSVHVLPLHEVESILCSKGVFEAVSKHVGLEQSEIDEKYNEFIAGAKSRFNDLLINKQILERVKRKTELQIIGVLNRLTPDSDCQQLKDNYTRALNVINWSFSPDEFFDDESNLVRSSLNSTDEEFLKIFPGKTIYSLAAEKVGVTVDRYFSLISTALNISDKLSRQPEFSAGLIGLKTDLIRAIEGILPERKFEPHVT